MADVIAAEDSGGNVQVPQSVQKVSTLLALFKDDLCVIIEGQPSIDDGPKVFLAADPLHNLSIPVVGQVQLSL